MATSAWGVITLQQEIHFGAAMIRFGPAGFDYQDWVGRVYPRPLPKKFDRLRYLSRYFDALEVNSSFYGPPTSSTTEDWSQRVEENPRFRFTLKLWQRFTHQREEAWSQEEVDQVRRGLDSLQEQQRLGALLLQFPWSFRRTEANQEWLHDLISAFPAYPLVLEVRHRSWATPEFFSSLLERGVGVVNVDQPLFRDSLRPGAAATSSVGYVRLHGRNYRDWFRAQAGRDARYDYLYGAEELKPWADRVQEIADSPVTQDTYAVTNNHFLGKAPANALMLQALVEGRRVECPPDLLATYGEALRPYVKLDREPGIGVVPE